MTVPAVRLIGFVESPGTVFITPGVDGFAALVSLVEPISAGLPPVRPAMVEGLDLGIRPSRIAPDACGYTGTAPLATSRRPTLTVNWRGLSDAERRSLEAFFADGVAGVGGSAFAFDVEIDGEAAGVGGDVVQVRPLAPIVFVPQGRGRAGVQWSASVGCEQIL